MLLSAFIILIVSFLNACAFSFSLRGEFVCVCVLCNPTLRVSGRSLFHSSDLDPFQTITKMCSLFEHWAQSARVFFSCMHLCVKCNVCVCVCSWFDLLSSVPRTVVRMVSNFFFCRPRKCVYCSHAMKSSGSRAPDRGHSQPLHSALTQAARECWKNAL